jgi:large subunit ribosomal protein L3
VHYKNLFYCHLYTQLILNNKRSMSIGILGVKLGMTQIFDESGLAIPVTVIKAGPCVITHLKTQKKEGYEAIQIGYSQTPQYKLSKPQLGHLEKSDLPPLKYLREYRVDSIELYSINQKITVDSFEVGQSVAVSGRSIGKGFQGTVKRYNFTRGPMTHGSKNHRAPGSIGQGSSPGKVHKGKKMAGRLGGGQSTVKNLKVIHINNANNLLVVQGTVPGKTGNLLSIQTK